MGKGALLAGETAVMYRYFIVVGGGVVVLSSSSCCARVLLVLSLFGRIGLRCVACTILWPASPFSLVGAWQIALGARGRGIRKPGIIGGAPGDLFVVG
jgi:hypothetical protein